MRAAAALKQITRPLVVGDDQAVGQVVGVDPEPTDRHRPGRPSTRGTVAACCPRASSLGPGAWPLSPTAIPVSHLSEALEWAPEPATLLARGDGADTLRHATLRTRRGVETHGGGGGEVEALGLAVDRARAPRRRRVRGSPRAGPRPRCRRSRRWARPWCPRPARRRGRRSPAPSAARIRTPGVPQPCDGLLDGDADGDRQMEERADGGPYGLGVVEVDGGVGEDDRVGARGVGAAQHRAGVAGVADVREHGDQPGPGARGSPRTASPGSGRRRRRPCGVTVWEISASTSSSA